MRRAFASAVGALVACSAVASVTVSKPEDVAKLIPQETEEARAARMAWWTYDRFGMFIHFGLYTLPARHEWIRNYEKITNEDYEKYFERFDPDLFDAKAWAKAAKAAGMKYAVLTTKHHEGFCLWDSKYTDYKVTKTPFGRDIVREFVDAFRAEGLKVGLYFSLIDWHHPDFLVDMNHPLRDQDRAKVNAGRDMQRYRTYMMNQIRELMTDYGKIDIGWFDYSYPGEDGKGRDDWDSAAILSLVRKLQPGIIVDNRLDLKDVPGGMDFITPEQYKVTAWPKWNGKRYPWETCQTFSGSWGYNRDEMTWKSPHQLVELLAHTVSHGGNLILNVGPTGRGQFDNRAEARLEAMGRWLALHARAIYGCTEPPTGIVAPGGTLLTYNPRLRRLYLCLPNYPMGRQGIAFADRVAYAQFLHDASEIRISDFCGELQKDTADESGYNGFLVLPVIKPDVEMPVVEMYLK